MSSVVIEYVLNSGVLILIRQWCSNAILQWRSNVHKPVDSYAHNPLMFEYLKVSGVRMIINQ